MTETNDPISPHPDADDGISRRKLLVLGAGAALLPLAGLATAGCSGGEEPADPYAGSPTGERPKQTAEAAPPRTEPPTPPPPDEQPASDATPRAAAPGDAAEGGSAQAAAGDANAKLVTEVAAMQPLVQSLQYTNESQKPDQRCANCQLFTAQDGGVGKCQLFTQGVVAEGGWCTSWVPRPQTTG